MKGVLNLYKPKGITSSAAVGKVRRILGTRSAGHMGTLDPAGEGVLLIGVGKATRLFDFYLTKDKTYEAEFLFGTETDTLDGDGAVIKQTGVVPGIAEIEAALPAFRGTVLQLPPRYSAKSIDGRRAYALAREGLEFALKPVPVSVYAFDCLERVDSAVYRFRIRCGAGTYIRSLCRDLAASLGTVATMISIRRVQCGVFSVDNAVTFASLEEKKEACLISVEEALCDLSRADLDDALFERLKNGGKITSFGERPGAFTVYCRGELFGIGKTENGALKIITYLRD